MTDEKSKKQMSYKERLSEGLVQYRQGSKKSELYQLFLSQGEDAVKEKGKALKLKESTIRAWLGDWKYIQKEKAPSPLKAEAPKARTNTKAAKKKAAPKPKTSAKKAA